MLPLNKHLGYLFVNISKQRPDEICHIDAFTDESETNASVLHRSTRLANALRRSGLVTGDVLAIGGRNHINVHIPYYAAMMNGLPTVGVDTMFKVVEIKSVLEVCEPKIVFCDADLYDSYKEAVSQLGLTTRVVKFGAGPESLEEFLKEYDDDTPDSEFQLADYDADKTNAWLVSTSGTTGTVKLAAIKHTAVIEKFNEIINSHLYPSAKSAVSKKKRNKMVLNLSPMAWISGYFNAIAMPLLHLTKVPSANKRPELSKHTKKQRNKMVLNLSPMAWISGYFNAIAMPLLHLTKVQTSANMTPEHVIDIINKYKPLFGALSPSLLIPILLSEKPCDLTCFNSIAVAGSKLHHGTILECRKRLRKDAFLMEAYGQTENLGALFVPNPRGPMGSCGVPVPKDIVKLVDPETEATITEPHVTGELWTKGVGFTEYYKNAEETERAFSADGWYKTGDLLYRDESHNYFFVERLKMLIKYKRHHIIPPELEAVILQHPAVLDVCVTSVPHVVDGEHPVACVVLRPGCDVTEQEIKDLVADKLSDSKQLRGGVVFMKELPMTAAGKVARAKLRQIVIEMKGNQC